MEIDNCLDCDGKSIAQMVDHICSDCEDLYVYCLDCSTNHGNYVVRNGTQERR